MDAAESMAEDQPSPPETVPPKTVPQKTVPQKTVPQKTVPQKTVPPKTVGGLTEREMQILAFERQWWRHAGAKENAIRERFSLSSTRYYQLLNTLLEKPEAVEADPMLVKRLRRTRAARQRKRGARRLGIELS